MALAVTIGMAIVVEEKSLRMAVTVRKVENDPCLLYTSDAADE